METPTEKRFRIFQAQKRTFLLADLVSQGNAAAECFADNQGTERVVGYIGDDEDLGPQGLIALDQQYWLMIGNCEWTADNEDDLIALERELFDWMIGEEMIDRPEGYQDLHA
jgi:hypothetical protein